MRLADSNMLIALEFIVATVIILAAGSQLSYYADVIAEKTRLGRALVGLVLLASITSLPELVTGMTSVVTYNLPEIAVGDVLGSCMFNLLIIVFLDRLSKAPVLNEVRESQKIASMFAIVLLLMITIALIAGDRFPSIMWFGVYSVVIVPAWLISILRVRQAEVQPVAGNLTTYPDPFPNITSRRAFSMFSLYAVVIVVVAAYLPVLGEEVAQVTGLGQTFVGNMFVALSTSLPELAVSLAALRIGAPDLAIANVLGSNLFNLVILALDDFAFARGPILAEVSMNHAIASAGAASMTVVVLLAITFQSGPKRGSLSSATWAMMAIYAGAGVLLLAVH